VSPLAVAVLVLAGGAVGARADTGVGSWSPTGALPEEAGLLPVVGPYPGSAVTLADGRVLEVPGEERDAELYDPASSTWTHGPHRLQEVEGQWTLVALAEGGALLLGATPCKTPGPEGERQCLPSTTVYRWSPGGVEWSPAAPMREARVRPVTVLLPDGRVLVAGGFGDHECSRSVASNERYSCKPLASAEIYDPASNEWTPTAPMPEARGGAVGTLLSGGTVLVVGGDGAHDAIRYDPSAESWTEAGETASSRTGALLFALPDDRALTLSGRPYTGFYDSPPIREYEMAQRKDEAEPTCNSGANSEIFGTATNAWMSSLAAPVGEGEGCPLLQGVPLVGGQILLRSDAESTYYVLDAEQRCWSMTPPPLEAHSGGEMVALSDGRVLVFGGYGNGHWLSTAEIYTPGTATCAQTSPSPIAKLSDPAPRPSRFTGATIARRKRLTVTAAGSIRLLVQCPASAVGRCVGHVQLTLLAATSTGARTRGHAKRLLLSKAPFAVAAGRTAWVTVRLMDHRRALHGVMHRGRHATTVVLTTTAHDDTGQAVTTTASGTLRGLLSV
jgi:Kelch motif